MKKSILVMSILVVVGCFLNVMAYATTSDSDMKSYWNIAPVPTNEMPIRVQLEGEYIDFTDEEGNIVNPKIIQNRTMVPMRKIFEEFGMQVEWNASSKSITAMNDEKIISLAIDGVMATVEDKKSGDGVAKRIELDVPPVLVENRTMVPVRFIAESLEKDVGWDARNKTVLIMDMNKAVERLKKELPNLEEFFALELEPIRTFKTSSDIKGSLVYKDKEDRKKNETIKVTGEMICNYNQDAAMELELELAFSGKGTIYDSIVEANMKKLKLGMVQKDDTTYVMIAQNGKEVWQASKATVDFSSLSNTTVTSYEELVERLKTTVGELDNITDYEQWNSTLDGMIVVLKNMEVKGTKTQPVIEFKLDFAEVMKEVVYKLAESKEIDTDIDKEFSRLPYNLKIYLKEKISKKKITSQLLNLTYSIEDENSGESIDLSLDIDMDYDMVNKDFKIATPKVKTK